jgi:threonine synthase
LAEAEGIFAETAGGVTTGVTKKLIEQGYIGANGTTVLCITGNGLKTIDAVSHEYSLTPAIAPRLAEFEAFINDRMVAVAGN